MFEALLLALIVVGGFVLVVVYGQYKENQALMGATQTLSSARSRMKITERKFMQGRIKRSVFEALMSDLEHEFYSAQLVLFRAHKSPLVSVEEKARAVLETMESPNKYRKSKIERILKETELLREELGLLETKLLKREIKEEVFERLVKEKESLLIKKEKELMDVVARAPEKSVAPETKTK